MSPVIGTILMVAIAVMLAAGVYVWVTMFDGENQATEQASIRTTGIDTDGDGAIDWIRATLTAGDNSPYADDRVSAEVIDPDGNLVDPALYNETDTSTPFVGSGETWAVGKSLYVPCQGSGDHLVTISLRGTVVEDGNVRCDESS